jgi:regulator of protease activity HflC (stomatin/prohibitin superfamily)
MSTTHNNQTQHQQHTKTKEIIIKDTHRGLVYEDGVLVKVVEAGRFEIPKSRAFFGLVRRPKVQVELIDVRQRDLTIKGQEILTSDKVAIRVSIAVQFRVVDPKAALHEVDNYEDRLYSDVQLAARRSLASMTLEDILMARNKLSEDILQDVQAAAARYGVTILRADVKDLIFPGNLQEIMNKVLAAERMSQVQLVEARTRSEVQRLDADTRATSVRIDAEAHAESQRIKTEADIRALRDREAAATAYDDHPVLLRLRELETMSDMAKQANARIYVGFDSKKLPTEAQ